MIRNDREYRYTCERIADFRRQTEAMAQQVREGGFSEDDIQLATAPTRALAQDLEWERDFYDRLRAEGPAAVPAYAPEDRGKALIALRIACGLSQRELAERLGVSEAQVSRDERHDYRGITQDRYARVLDALGVEERSLGYRRRQPPTRPPWFILQRHRMHEAAPVRPDPTAA